jgi:hypothetical protein
MKKKEKIETDVLNDFVLDDTVSNEDDNNTFDVIGTSEDILDFDFGGDEEFKLEESYEYVEKINIINQNENNENEIKKREAENIIKEYSSKFIDEEMVNDINKGYNNFKKFLRKFSTENQDVKDMSEQQRTKLFGVATFLFNKYNEKYKNIIFNLDLTRKEHKFLYTTFNKIEYGPDEVFQMWELKNRYLNNHIDVHIKLPKDIDIIPTIIDINMLIILYHLISLYKVKGTGEEFYTYKNILTKIGERIKLINAYNVMVERLNNEFTHWINTLNSLDMIEDVQVEEYSDSKLEIVKNDE